MHWRVARSIALGSAVLALVGAAGAQAQELTLAEALQRAGVEAPSGDSGSVPAVPAQGAAPQFGPAPSIQAAQADVEAARGDARQFDFRPNPGVSLTVENFGGSGGLRGINLTEETLSVGQRIELGGKRGARRRAANAEVDVAQLRSAIAIAELGAGVRERYAGAVAAALRLQLARDIVDRAQELARVARELVDAGRDPPLRALRAEAALGEARAALSEAEADDLAARLALVSLWGSLAPPDSVALIWPEGMRQAAALPERTLAVRLAEAEARAAGLVIARERANAVPDLTLSGGVRRFEETGDHAFVAGASIDLPFGNRNQGAIAAAEARRRAAEARRTAALAEAARAVTTARVRADAAARRVETLQQMSVPQAEEALRLAQLGYRYGKFTLLDVLDAAAARDAARRGLIDAHEALSQAEATLLRLLFVPENIK